MVEIRAADLPEGTVVATADLTWIKRSAKRWEITGRQSNVTNARIDAVLASGATVLRHGYGEENQP